MSQPKPKARKPRKPRKPGPLREIGGPILAVCDGDYYDVFVAKQWFRTDEVKRLSAWLTRAADYLESKERSG